MRQLIARDLPSWDLDFVPMLIHLKNLFVRNFIHLPHKTGGGNDHSVLLFGHKGFISHFSVPHKLLKVTLLCERLKFLAAAVRFNIGGMILVHRLEGWPIANRLLTKEDL